VPALTRLGGGSDGAGSPAAEDEVGEPVVADPLVDDDDASVEDELDEVDELELGLDELDEEALVVLAELELLEEELDDEDDELLELEDDEDDELESANTGPAVTTPSSPHAATATRVRRAVDKAELMISPSVVPAAHTAGRRRAANISYSVPQYAATWCEEDIQDILRWLLS
jgi:hypothetical protein